MDRVAGDRAVDDLCFAAGTAGEHAKSADRELGVVAGNRGTAQEQIARLDADASAFLGTIGCNRPVLEFNPTLRKNAASRAQGGINRSIIIDDVGVEAQGAPHGINSATVRVATR